MWNGEFVVVEGLGVSGDRRWQIFLRENSAGASSVLKESGSQPYR